LEITQAFVKTMETIESSKRLCYQR